jgi:TRAP-type C4-dicarboxylate transport system permease small subunit
VALLVVLTATVSVAVVVRELGAALSWYDEVATVFLAWLTYYGAALAALRRGHLGSPEILRLVPMSYRLPLFVIGEGLVIAFFLVLGWAGLEVVILLEGDRLISLPWVPVQLTQSVIPAGAALFILAELLSIPDEWANLRERRLPTEQI